MTDERLVRASLETIAKWAKCGANTDALVPPMLHRVVLGCDVFHNEGRCQDGRLAYRRADASLLDVCGHSVPRHATPQRTHRKRTAAQRSDTVGHVSR